MSNLYLAPAKINLHLAITETLENSYHALDTSFVYVDVYDVLMIKVSNALQVSCNISKLNGQENLVFKVLNAFRVLHNVSQGLTVHVEKRLPSQAGLGGGSSDAATALMVANKLWQVDCSQDELITFSKDFGADIPSFIFGRASLATGIGEKLVPYPSPITKDYVVLAWPGKGVSTVAAFEHFDKNKYLALTDEKTAAKVRARSGADGFDLGYNDLEPSAVFLCPPLKDLLSVMRKKSKRAWMSGSGSACVAILDSLEQANELAMDLQNHKLASWVHVGHFLPHHPVK